MTAQQLTGGRSRGDAPTIRNNSSSKPTLSTRRLARIGLALAVLAATVAAGAGGMAAPAAAAPAAAVPVASSPNGTAAAAPGSFVGSSTTLGPAPGPGDLSAHPLGTLGIAGESSIDSEEDLQMDVVEVNEEYIAVEVRIPPRGTDNIEHTYLGLRDQFVVHDDEDAASLPRETDGLARPVETRAVAGHDGHWVLHFRTEDVDLSAAEGEELTLALGAFSDDERTVSDDSWDTDTVFINIKPRGW